MKNQYSNIKFSDKYLIKTEEYEDVGIITFPFSVRAHNCFKKAKIKTVASLIQCSELELMEIQGFGRKCLKEVNHFCSNLSKLKVKTGLIGKTQNENCYYLINKFQKEILNGDFSFIDQISLKNHEKIYLLKLEDAYVNLGREFVFFCINSSRKIPSLISVISNFKEKTLFLSEINSNFRDIPKGRHSQKVFGYINAFTSKLDKQKKLKKVCFSDDECFYSFYENVISSDFQHDYILFSSFFKWSSFDLHGEINKIFEVLYFNTTIKLVVQSRTIGKTLAEIGENDLAYSLLLQRDNPSWLYSVDQGATTIWERWNSYTLATGFGNVAMNSFNHYAYGAVQEWLYRHAAGIEYDPAAPGFERAILQPKPDTRTADELPEGQENIKYLKTSYESYHGTIVSNWSTENGFDYYCEVAMPTRLYLPILTKNDSFTLNGVSHKFSEFHQAPYNDRLNRIVIDLAPGKYQFNM